ncbi:hypothetical protein J6590_065951 [Homalodisca vitripennis]|nr:hypothetical protein J6590_065951 [Homalodisca vitripennis]
MAERSKSSVFGSELQIAQVQILSVTVALFISFIDRVLYQLSPLRSSHKPLAHEGRINVKRGSASPLEGERVSEKERECETESARESARQRVRELESARERERKTESARERESARQRVRDRECERVSERERVRDTQRERASNYESSGLGELSILGVPGICYSRPPVFSDPCKLLAPKLSQPSQCFAALGVREY